MDILGIGPAELLFILLIAIIVLGPKDMVKAGRQIGHTLRRIVRSEEWRVMQNASRELRQMPNRLMREAELEDLQQELRGQFNQPANSRHQTGSETSELTHPRQISPFSAWTTQTGPNSATPPGSQPATIASDTLSAWTTPPQESQSGTEHNTTPPDSPTSKP